MLSSLYIFSLFQSQAEVQAEIQVLLERQRELSEELTRMDERYHNLFTFLYAGVLKFVFIFFFRHKQKMTELIRRLEQMQAIYLQTRHATSMQLLTVMQQIVAKSSAAGLPLPMPLHIPFPNGGCRRLRLLRVARALRGTPPCRSSR